VKEIAPRVTRAAVIRDETNPAGIGQFAVIQSVARSFAVELRPVVARDRGEIERAVTAFARSPNGGLIVLATAWGALHSDLFVMLADRYRLPAVYPFLHFVIGGGRISY